MDPLSLRGYLTMRETTSRNRMWARHWILITSAWYRESLEWIQEGRNPGGLGRRGRSPGEVSPGFASNVLLTVSEIKAFISAQCNNSSLSMQLRYTLSFCSDNFLYPGNTFNSSLFYDFISPGWNSVFKSLSATSSLQSFVIFRKTLSLLLFLEVWCQQRCIVSIIWVFVQKNMICSVLFQMLLFDYILNFDVLFYKYKEILSLFSGSFLGLQILSQNVLSIKYRLDLASYFSKFQSSAVSSEILELPLCTFFWDYL